MCQCWFDHLDQPSMQIEALSHHIRLYLYKIILDTGTVMTVYDDKMLFLLLLVNFVTYFFFFSLVAHLSIPKGSR